MKKTIIGIIFALALAVPVMAQELLVDNMFEGTDWHASIQQVRYQHADNGWVAGMNTDWAYNATDDRAERFSDGADRSFGQLISLDGMTAIDGYTLKVWGLIDDDASVNLDFHISLWGYTADGAFGSSDRFLPLSDYDTDPDSASYNFTATALVDWEVDDAGDQDYTTGDGKMFTDIDLTGYDFVALRIGITGWGSVAETIYFDGASLAQGSAAAQGGSLFTVK